MKYLYLVFLYLIDQFELMRIFPSKVTKIHSQIAVLYGAKNALLGTKMFISKIMAVVFLIILISVFLALLEGRGTIFIWSVFMILLSPLAMIKNLDKKIKKRRRAIILELPLFLNKIMLLVNAGETVQKAIIRCVEQRSNPESHPLYAEFIPLINQLKINYSFHQAMEELSIRCGVQEVSIFTNTVLLNYRRGGSEFVTALRAISLQLWGTRKAIAKTLGEEASSKLVFPLVLIFVVVMMIVAAPAMMLIK